ncbi:MAG: OmpA family protein [Rhodospirillales bacterium]|nr:OmpA family protein [Rhodospirillales bacterium]MCB9995459.1 OmpA family protein [Rhodospirillales bacterium]
MSKLRGIMMVFGMVALSVALSACTNFKTHSEIEALNEVQPVGSPFTQHLAAEYRAFANSELNEMLDYPDALHFARKGLAAASGETVMPEPIADWNLLPRHMEELSAARGRMIVAFDLGAREIAPQQAAVAQSRFDCWIEQQEENWQDDDIMHCKNQYLEAIAALESMLQPYQPVPEPVAPAPAMELPVAAEPMTPDEAMYLVFFDFDKHNIGAGGQNVLDAVAEEIKSRTDIAAVTIVGHTDSSGPKSYNNKLAMKRANAVRDGLIERGIMADTIRVEGRGEDELLVQTADGVREPANRRAQITFE